MSGNPTPISWPKIYTSLAAAQLTGQKNSITDIVEMKFHEHLKHTTLSGHAYMGVLQFFSEARWQQFPRAHQCFLFDGFQQLKTTAQAFPMRKHVPAYEDFKKFGRIIHFFNSFKKCCFQTFAAPVYSWYLNKFGDEWLFKSENAVAQCNATFVDNFLTATKPKLRD